MTFALVGAGAGDGAGAAVEGGVDVVAEVEDAGLEREEVGDVAAFGGELLDGGGGEGVAEGGVCGVEGGGRRRLR